MTIAQCKASRRRVMNDKRWRKRDPNKSARRDQQKLDKAKAQQQRSKK